jgi:hypothetical protein
MFRDQTSRGLLVAALACLTIALFPNWDERVDPETGARVSAQTLGLWFSPLHESVRQESESGFTWKGGVRWLSWSWVFVVIAVGCFEALRVRHREYQAERAE